MEIVHDQLAKRQLMDASAKSLIKLMTATCGYSEGRQLASQKLELWLQNPKVIPRSLDAILRYFAKNQQSDYFAQQTLKTPKLFSVSCPHGRK